MRRYPKHTESGVEWVGEIPTHWQIGKIKHIVTLVNEKSIPESGAIKISPENVESETGKVLDFYSSYDVVGVIFQAGDVLFNKLRVYLSKVVFAEYTGFSLGEMIVIRPSLQCTGKYIFYLMLSCRFIEYCNSMSYGAKMPRTDINDILNTQIPSPTSQEQTQIANFLDHKTAQIDELIRIKERKVELLREQRTALINQAVTKGLDPNVDMKPSGAEWIGEIPAHWEAKRLGHVSTIFKGGTPKRNVDRYFQGNLPWARPVDITVLKGALYIHDAEVHISEEALGNSGARRLPPGTVLLTSRATIGETAIATVPIATNQGFANFVCNEVLLNIYLVYYLRAIKDLLISLGNGSTFLEVTKGTLVRVGIPLPSLSEQTQIASFLNRKNAQIDELISEEQRSIKLLKEYRQSLISDAVTGKIDVRSEV